MPEGHQGVRICGAAPHPDARRFGATIEFCQDYRDTRSSDCTPEVGIARARTAPRDHSSGRKNTASDLGEFEGHAFQVLNTNDHGLLNGSIFAGPGVQRAVAWLPGEGFVYLDGTNTGGTLGSNDRGAIAGTRTGIGTSAAFIWTQDAGVQLVPLAVDGRSIRASSGGDVNDDGAVAGTLTLRSITAGPNENRGYVWHATGGTTLIPPLGPAAVGVTFISEEGMVLGASETRLPLPGERRASPLRVIAR